MPSLIIETSLKLCSEYIKNKTHITHLGIHGNAFSLSSSLHAFVTLHVFCLSSAQGLVCGPAEQCCKCSSAHAWGVLKTMFSCFSPRPSRLPLRNTSKTLRPVANSAVRIHDSISTLDFWPRGVHRDSGPAALVRREPLVAGRDIQAPALRGPRHSSALNEGCFESVSSMFNVFSGRRPALLREHPETPL